MIAALLATCPVRGPGHYKNQKMETGLNIQMVYLKHTVKYIVQMQMNRNIAL